MTSRISREAQAAVGLALAFAALTLYVRFVGPIPGDRWAMEKALGQGVSEPRSGAFQFFTGLGSPYVAVATVAIGVLILLRNVSAWAAGMLVVAAGVVVAEQVLQQLIGGTSAAAELTWPPGGYPSGHVAYATAAFGYLGWLGRRQRRPEVVVVCAILIAGMAVSRIGDRSHLLHEVLGGILLGAAWVAVMLVVRRPSI